MKRDNLLYSALKDIIKACKSGLPVDTHFAEQALTHYDTMQGEDDEHSLRYSLRDVNSAYNKGVLDGLSNDDPNHNQLVEK